MPERNGKWYGSKWITRKRRLAIYARDGHRCVWCLAQGPLSLDHLWRPRAGKYDNRTASLVTACFYCNSRRAGRSIAAFLRNIECDGADVSAVVARVRQAIRAPAEPSEETRDTRKTSRWAARHFRANEAPFLDLDNAAA